MKLTGLSEKVFLDRYSLKDKAGKPVEKTPERMIKRVAKAVAAIEKRENQKKWEKEFYNAMDDFKYVPGGRILAGAGTGFEVTYYNCFVLPSPSDSREGILDTLKQMVEIMARGGGVGINLSSLRPRGHRVEKVNGFSSGPCNWAELFSVATKDIIQQGGSRRGALMLMLWDWHPDIEEFITVKQDLTRINGANLSVCVSDSFMEAVEKDGDWELIFPDRKDPEYDAKWDGDIYAWKELGKRVVVHKTIKARAMWDLVADAAWKSAEPGVVFMERYNKLHNNWYWNRINCVNPCVTGDTLVATEVGWLPAKELKPGIKIATPQGLKPIEKIYNNGKKRIFKIKFSDGGELKATGDHKLKVVRNKKYEWVKSTDLKVGDKVVVIDNTYFEGDRKLEISPEVREYAKIHNIILDKATDRDFGLIFGASIGDGYFRQTGKKYGYALKIALGRKEKKWGEVLENKFALFGVTPSYARYEHQLIHADGTVVTHGSDQLLFYKFANILGLLELPTKRAPQKEIPDIFFNLSLDFQRGLLDGLFSTDGSVSLKSYDPLLRLTSASSKLLQQARLLLLNFGIHSRIYKSSRKKTIYDGRDMTGTGVKYELVIMNEGIAKFSREIGISHPEKNEKLKKVAEEYYFMSGTNLAAVKEVVDTGVNEEVFDVYEPETLTWVTNGYVSLDCGEEGLPAWGVCNLGSINLSALVQGNNIDRKGKFDFKELKEVVRVAVRFQDNVIEMDPYVFDGIRKTQYEGERRIGLGTMGLGDMLIKLHMRYGSEESLKLIDKIYKIIRDEAYSASVDIAHEKGSFGKFDKKLYPQGKFIRQLPEDIQEGIKKIGIRNSILLMQAPTGSTSLLVNTTSGIEPVYEYEFIRRDRIGEHIVHHHLYEKWFKKHGGDLEAKKIEKPTFFVSANDLTPEDHIRVQATVQKYVDASISKTVNAPQTHTVDDVKRLYTLAYKLGCKGVAYMREGSRAGVLERVDDKKKEEKQEVGEILQTPPITKRPPVMYGLTYKTQTPLGDAFITLNKDDSGNPFETFITIGKSGSDVAAMADALGRMISLALRLQSPVPARERVRQIVAQLSGIGGVRTIGFGENKVRSVPDAVAKVLAEEFGFSVNGVVMDLKKKEQLMSNGDVQSQAGAAQNFNPNFTPIESGSIGVNDSNGHSQPLGEVSLASLRSGPLAENGQSNGLSNGESVGANGNGVLASTELQVSNAQDATVVMEQLSISGEPSTQNSFDLCPSCGGATLAHEEGCKKCYSCGYSEC